MSQASRGSYNSQHTQEAPQEDQRFVRLRRTQCRKTPLWTGELSDTICKLGNPLFISKVFFLAWGASYSLFELFHIKLLKHFNRAFNRFCQIEGKQIERVWGITLCNHDTICDKGAGLSRALTSPLIFSWSVFSIKLDYLMYLD